MAEPFDAREYAAYLRRRWAVFVAVCGAAAALALAVSFALPRLYTATVRIVIEPAAVLPSPSVTAVYLDSLRTYEAYAASDEIFAGAAEKFHLASAQKYKVLSVTKPDATRILEIRATLGDPREALELARYIAAQTVALNRSVNAAFEREDSAASLAYADARRGDRLEIVDHGTVPGAPSSPKTTRNVEAAVLIALIATLVWLSARFR
jgi:capsular polysaccharide biosynthesis protein